jgi:three-Cys-motif partner protein
MSWNQNIVSEPKGEWGGSWTEKKLNAFSKYVWSYLIIMKNFAYWETIYFDGFAGSGSKTKEEKSEIYKQLLITEEEEKTYKGAAERVLSLNDNLSFNYYYFIDKSEASLKKLELNLKKKVNIENKHLVFRSGNANLELLKLAEALKSNKYAALIFLDPFGMQIDWSSIEALRGLRSDIWILIPTGVIVNRLLDKKGELKYDKKLESFFGLNIEEIKNIFYKSEKRQTLFGEEEVVTKVSEPIEKIAKLYAKRLGSIWENVTEIPLMLPNKNGIPIFHFVFASNNKNAMKIAKQIIQNPK